VGVGNTYRLWPAAAAGPSADDFFVLAHSSEYDRAYASRNKPTPLLPTSRYTFVLHFVEGKCKRARLFRDRLLDITWSAKDNCAYAVGFPRRIHLIDAERLTPLVMPDLTGTMFAVSASPSGRLLTCGIGSGAVAIARDPDETWHTISLPAGIAVLSGILATTVGDWFADHATALLVDGVRADRTPKPISLRIVGASGRFATQGSECIVPGLAAALPRDGFDGLGRVGLAIHGNELAVPTTRGVLGWNGSRITQLTDAAGEGVASIGDALVVMGLKGAWLVRGETKQRLAMEIRRDRAD
jgi:hypothetical protein